MNVRCAILISVSVLATVPLMTAPADAGWISDACLRANRDAASKEVCTCIDEVAQISLTRAERKKVSKFFRDPHKTQIIRASDRRSDKKFWERYQTFGARARQICR